MGHVAVAPKFATSNTNKNPMPSLVIKGMCRDAALCLLLALIFSLTAVDAQDASSEAYGNPLPAAASTSGNSIFGSVATVESARPTSSADLFGIPSYLQTTNDTADNIAVQWNLVQFAPS